MDAIFLSASVPLIGRGEFYKTASPFLIQIAVREFLVATLGRRLIVWGGHPAITPMVWAACEDLNTSYAQAVVLYQSKYFQDSYPEENAKFKNVVFTPAVEGDCLASLRAMRVAMLSRKDLVAAVFVGGMEGVFEEHELFTKLHPKAQLLTVAGPGGAARELAARRGEWNSQVKEDLDFARLFHEGLGIKANERRIAAPKLARQATQEESAQALARPVTRRTMPKKAQPKSAQIQKRKLLLRTMKLKANAKTKALKSGKGRQQ